MAVRINLEKAIKNLDNIWKRIGTFITQWIRRDARRGVYQTPSGASTKPSYNRQYAKYKSNYMQRFSDGKKLKRYTATSTNPDTKYVNLELTGDLFNGLKVRDHNDKGVEIGYDSGDRKKIEGNRVYGREVVGLNDANIKKVKEMLVKAMGDNLKQEMKDININIQL